MKSKTTDWWARCTKMAGGSGEWDTNDDLSKQRKQFEAIVEPHLSNQKTSDAICFRGTTRFVAEPLEERSSELLWSAVVGLQFSYMAAKAIATGDARRAAGLANVAGYIAAEIDLLQGTGHSSEWARKKHLEASGRGQDTRIDIPKLILESAISNNMHKKNWLAGTTTELLERHKIQVSTKTVRRRMDEFGLKHESKSKKREAK